MSILHEDDIVRVTVAGEIDVANARVLARGLDEAIADAVERVEVDLGDTWYFGSEGISALLAAVRDARRAVVEIRVVAASDMVRRVLEVTATDDFVGLEPFDPAAASRIRP